jgi:hypothetical protein
MAISMRYSLAIRWFGFNLTLTQGSFMGYVALEVSYSVYPAIIETMNLLAEAVKPALDRGGRFWVDSRNHD